MAAKRPSPSHGSRPRAGIRSRLLAESPERTSAIEKFKLARGFIEHENTLVGQRITWFLTLQGFLFGAYFLAARLPWDTSLEKAAVRPLAIAGIWVISLLGIGSSVVVFILLAMALAELKNIVSWWNAQDGHESFPRVTALPAKVNAHWFAIAFLVAWLGLLGTFTLS